MTPHLILATDTRKFLNKNVNKKIQATKKPPQKPQKTLKMGLGALKYFSSSSMIPPNIDHCMAWPGQAPKGHHVGFGARAKGPSTQPIQRS